MKEKLNEYLEILKDKTPQEVLEFAKNEFGIQNIKLASSLSVEDMILTEMFVKISKDAQIFVLDTGRLFQETYDLIQLSSAKYGIKYQIFFPDYKELEEIVSKKGVNLFYYSIEDRKLCCKIRKLNPLKRALENTKLWICGLRKSQSITRENIQVIEWDDNHNIFKINPICNWEDSQVWEYVKKNNIPYNYLHDKGFKSIGCLPCTKEVRDGDDPRSGRWWWENPDSRECGLHVKK
ncbi:MAG: phosphoadenosine phosphosulfate reductase [Spirochaetes bacterium GWD1_27_9]|nr:MAG: phosphoadenosine phosphosulfate reductase [Spirochaetes bacterium GWB1_27_13]OHD24219.1 MAG: phosphoadenosine phosphosulfate reductase [Spirochaetes bacterium GWC1_27_15]OHD33614.1 MAG: phosphoadenosine phosphosulfate reductase [Spirochaetes bacterium GWD1_27_9]